MNSLLPFITARNWPFFAALASALILGGAYIFEYGFGYAPCALCYDQRHIHMAVIALGLVGGLALTQKSVQPFAMWVCFALAALLIYSAAFAGWHAGIEWDWWDGPSTCTTGASVNVSMDDIASLLAGNGDPIVVCDEAAWRFLGISMAGYNALMSAGLAAISIFVGVTRK